MLPPAQGGKEIIPESMVWLLLTGQVPTEQQTRDLSRELAEKGDLPDYAVKLLDSCVHSLRISIPLNLNGVPAYRATCTL